MGKTILLYYSNRKTFDEYKELFPFSQLINETKSKIIEVYSYPYTKDGSIFKLKIFTKKIVSLQFKINMYHRRFSSASYQLQANKLIPSIMHRNTTQNYFTIHKKSLPLFEIVLIKSLANKIGITLISAVMAIAYRIENLIFKIKYHDKFDLFVLPYTGGISAEWDFLVWYGKKNNIKTLGIQENWDNLSSKIFQINMPDFFATWGKQSSSHLRVMQNYRGIVKEVGCLRIQPYYNCLREVNGMREIVNNSDEDHDTREIVLIVGVGDNYYDSKLIGAIQQYLITNPLDLMEKFRFIYRPHPYAKIYSHTYDILNDLGRYDFLEIAKPLQGEPNQTRIDLVQKSTFIVSFYSTMILEASILSKICIIPDFLDDNLGSRALNYIDDFAHYQGISLFTNIHTVDSIHGLFNILKASLIVKNSETNSNILLNWFCKNNADSSELISFVKDCFTNY
jgi:hypothetical protein